jgi:hypothetical protein
MKILEKIICASAVLGTATAFAMIIFLGIAINIKFAG